MTNKKSEGTMTIVVSQDDEIDNQHPAIANEIEKQRPANLSQVGCCKHMLFLCACN